MSALVAERGSEHPVARGLALIKDGVEALLEASAWSLSDREVRDALTVMTGLAARVEAARAVLVRENVSREALDVRGRRGERTVAALTARGRVSPARARSDVANAVATCPDQGDLRELGAAWAAGEVSREHVDVARRCLKRLPRQVVRDRREEVDAVLTDHARQWDPGTAETLARHLLGVLAPDRADRYDEHALERRHLAVHTDSTGMVLVQGQLDPAAGLSFTATLDHLVEQDRAAGGDAAGSDLRTRGQRRADALVQMADLAAEQLAVVGTTGSARAARAVPRVVVVSTPDQLAGEPGAGAAVTTAGDLVQHGTLTRLACDAVFDRVVLDQRGRVVSMTSSGRLATPAQLVALAVRDGGCTWPGCAAPPALCEAHHVVWWSRGGPTTIDNLALLCSRHHSRAHAEPDDGWTMVMRNGVAWFRRPRRLDPNSTLCRHTLHATISATRKTVRRWTESPGTGPPDAAPP